MIKHIINTVKWWDRRAYLGDAVISPGCLIDLRHSYHKKGLYVAIPTPEMLRSCVYCDLYDLCCKHHYCTYTGGIPRCLCYPSGDVEKRVVFVKVDKMLEEL